MSYQLIAALDCAAARDNAPVDPEAFIPDGYCHCDNPLGSNSLDERGQKRLRDWVARTGWVRVANTGDEKRNFRRAVQAEEPPEGFRWVMGDGGPRLWPSDKPLPKNGGEWPHRASVIEALWIDGVRIQ